MDYPVEDLAIQTSAGQLAFQRSYSSKAVDRYTAPLGYGWTHNLDTRLIFPTDPGGKAGYVFFKAHSANLYRFYVYGDGRFSPVPGVMGSLVRNPSPPVTYTLQTESQNTYLFNEAGKLLTWTDPKGHSLTYSYDANNRLDLITADGGSRYLDIGYDAQGRLATVADHAGRCVFFGYDASGDLVTAVDALGGTWQYNYGSKHELTEVIDPQGKTVVRTEYEESTAEPLNFNNLAITSYAGEDVNSTISIEDSGATLHITGNGWKKVEIPYVITDKTILEYDFRSPAQGEVHGIGYDNDNILSEKRTFKLYGTQNYGLTTFNNYAGSAPNWKHYRIPLGQYYSGDALYLFFANDHDVTTPTAQSYFSNVRLYEDNGLRAVRQYDGEDNLVVEITYNADGTTTLTDALGNDSVHTYDNRRTITGETSPTGADMSKTYDPHFRTTSITDPLDHSKTFVWSPDGANLTKVVDAEGNQTDIVYDAVNNITSITDPRNHQTTFTYSGKRLLSAKNALDKTTNFTYTPEGYLASVADPLTHTTSYTYNSHGQVLSMTDPMNHTWFYSYDSLGNLVDTTDPLEHVTHNDYDTAGRLIRVTQNYDTNKLKNEDDEWNIVTEYAYDVRGNRISVTDTYEHVTHYEYDNADRLIKVIDPEGNETTNTYNDAGQLITTTDALEHATHYSYDDAGRLTTTIDALGHTTSLTYNPDGTVATRTDGNNVVTHYEYDSVKRLTAVIENYRPGFQPDEETNVRTEYEYDDSGNLIVIRDANTHETHFTYDALNRMELKSDALGNEWEYFYDDAGQLSTITDANNQTVQFTYDANGQLTLIDYPAPDADVSFTYDALGRRTDMLDGIGTTEWGYDALSRPENITDPSDNVVSYEYDALGNLTTLHYPDGKTAEYTYNLNNLLTGVTDWNNGITSYDYDGAGQLLAVSRPNDVDTTYNYDNAGRLLSITHQNALQTLASYVYQYDNAGNRIQAIESVLQPELPEAPMMMPEMPEQTPTDVPTPTATLEDTPTPILEPTFTPASTPTETETPTPSPEPTLTPTETAAPTPNAFLPDFLQVAYHPPQALRFQSDFNPARLQQTLDQVIDYDYDPLYRLTAADYSTGDYFHYTYDYVGNRLTQAKSVNGVQSSDTYVYNVANQISSVNGVNFTWDANGNLVNDGVNTYTYDHADRLITVQNPTTTIENGYNGLGDRVQQSVDSATTNFTLDINSPLTQVLADGTNTYLYGLERITQSSLTTEYFLTDALGSVRQLANANGEVQSAISYEPFGAQLTDGASSYGFAGEWQDPTGLVYLRARFYSPTQGRFITRDPFPGILTQPASLSPYLYAYNNPVLLTDPSGENPLLLAGLLGSAISGFGLNEGMCPLEALNALLDIYFDPPTPNSGNSLLSNINNKIVSLPFSAEDYSNLATGLDAIAWGIDLFSVGVVTFGGIFGAGLGAPFLAAGSPEVPVVTGAAGAGIAELYVQTPLNVANGLATASSFFTTLSDIKKGNTVLSEYKISPTVLNSWTLTGIGWLNKEAYISFTYQTIAITNDLNWTSLPFH